MTSKLVGMLLVGCIALSGCGRDSGVVGSYIGGDSTGRLMLQISSANEHEIKGKLIAVSTDDAGSVTAVDRSLEGTIDGEAVNLNVETGSGLSLLTGKTTDQGLELTAFAGGKSQKLTFKRSDPTEFASLVDSVRRRAAEIKLASAKDAANRDQMRRDSADQDRISAFATAISSKADHLSDTVGRIDNLIAAYRSTSSQAARLGNERAKIVAIGGTDDVRADQISFARERNSDAAQTQHEMVLDGLKSVNEAAARNEAEASAIAVGCQSNSNVDCRGVFSAMALYRSRVAAFRDAAAREQTAYDAERSKF